MFGDDVPQREELIARFDRANRYAATWVLLEVLAMVAVASAIDWPRAVDQPFIAAVAVASVLGPAFLATLQTFAEKKVEVRNLKESTRFGRYGKDQLRDLFRDTLFRLGLPDDNLPLYVTGDRTLGARSSHLGLGSLSPTRRGAYLYRQSLFRLEPAEVQSQLGSELGHSYRYRSTNDRFQIVTLVLGGLFGLWLSQYIGRFWTVSFFALFVAPAAFWWATDRLWTQNAMLVEVLCDDQGAQVHGAVTAINALLQVGADAELLFAVEEQSWLNPEAANWSPEEVARAVEQTILPGEAEPAALEEAIRQSRKARLQKKEDLSVGGFLKYAWTGGEEEDEVDTLRALSMLLRGQHRLDWESLRDPRTKRLTEHGIEQLLELLDANPDAVLFRSVEEIGAGHGPEVVGEVRGARLDGIRAPLAWRIRYLWENREAIDAERRNRR